MQVIVDLSRCQGYGNCVQAAPAVFDLDDETAQVIVLDPEPPPELHDAARQAAAVCPVQAITLELED